MSKEGFDLNLVNELKNEQRRFSVRGFVLAMLKVFSYLIITAVAVCCIAALIFILNFAPYYSAIKESYVQLKIGQAYLDSGKDSLLAFKLDAAKVKFQLAGQNLQQAQKAWQELNKSLLRSFPVVSRQINSIATALDAGTKVSDVMFNLAGMGQKIAAAGLGVKSFSDLSGENKTQLLALLDSLSPDIKKTDEEMQTARQEFLDFKNSSVVPLFYDIGALDEQFALLGDITGKLNTAAAFLPDFLGYQKEKTYLFLLQNNSEMRPSGGFLGTYGIVKLLNADINKFFTDNIYNLDKKSESYLKIASPEPMKKYMNQPLWFMRDVNWSPDFAESAKKAMEFYDLERGAEPRFDGVIGITPTVIADLLKVVGPIKVEDLNFTADNFINTLQYEVEYGYKTKGTEFKERKSVIGKLGGELQARLFKLPLMKIGELVSILKADLENKQIVFYFKDAGQQKIVEQYDWAGRVEKERLDYFMVIDANLAALKTDPVVKRSIQYLLYADRIVPEAELKIKYEHQAPFSLLVTRYRSWTRIYLPNDVEITDVQISGKKITDYVVTTELGKKVVGLFLNVEPQTSETILVHYKFGATWQEKLKELGYSMLVQKQIGLPQADISLDLSLPYKVASFPTLGTKIAPNRILYSGVLDKDLEFGIGG
jgi:hypothetical protein